jgi:drug/metabolite transporter (DMT)-like permease
LSTKSWGKFILLSLIWGTTYLWVKLAVHEVGPFTLVIYRLLFAWIGLSAIIRLRRTGLPPRRFWPALLALGFFNLAMPFFLVAWAEKTISSGMVAVLMSADPLFTFIMASFFLTGERFHGLRVVGILAGFSGVIILLSSKLSAAEHLDFISMAAILVAAFGYAVSNIIARKHTLGLDSSLQAWGQTFAAILMVLPVTLMTESPFHVPQLPLTWITLLILGLLCTCLAHTLYFDLILEIGASRTALISYIKPLISVLLGIVFLAEQPTLQLAIGGSFIIAGVILVNSKKESHA